MKKLSLFILSLVSGFSFSASAGEPSAAEVTAGYKKIFNQAMTILKNSPTCGGCKIEISNDATPGSWNIAVTFEGQSQPVNFSVTEPGTNSSETRAYYNKASKQFVIQISDMIGWENVIMTVDKIKNGHVTYLYFSKTFPYKGVPAKGEVIFGEEYERSPVCNGLVKALN